MGFVSEKKRPGTKMSCVKVPASVPDMQVAHLAALGELPTFHIIDSQQESHGLGSPGSHKNYSLLSKFPH